MKALLYGYQSPDFTGLLKEIGIETVEDSPDLIITYGGDGTLLSAERQYPGIPKLPIRDSKICKKCLNHGDKTVLKKLTEGKLKLVQYSKLETTIFYKKLLALNDFVIRNSLPIHTIRFQTSLSGNKLLIGDGIVVSTPFGSSGYFKSITHKTFERGYGVAFNNTTEKIAPVFLNDKEELIFKLIRGIATLSLDNNPDVFNIDEGSEVTFKLSDQTAKIYESSLRCPNCKVIRN